MIRETPATHKKGRQLRHNMYSVGIVHHLLKCLSLASHHPPRRIKEEEAAVESAPPVGKQPIRLVNIPAFFVIKCLNCHVLVSCLHISYTCYITLIVSYYTSIK